MKEIVKRQAYLFRGKINFWKVFMLGFMKYHKIQNTSFDTRGYRLRTTSTTKRARVVLCRGIAWKDLNLLILLRTTCSKSSSFSRLATTSDIHVAAALDPSAMLPSSSLVHPDQWLSESKWLHKELSALLALLQRTSQKPQETTPSCCFSILETWKCLGIHAVGLWLCLSKIIFIWLAFIRSSCAEISYH